MPKSGRLYGYNPVNKIIAIGDLHGDYTATIEILILCKLIPKNSSTDVNQWDKIKWIGGDTYLVQLGDILDSKKRVNNSLVFNDNEFYIICLFLSLNKQAQREKGKIILLLGNHELMNITGDFRYVSTDALDNNGGHKMRTQFFKPGNLFCTKMSELYHGVAKIGNFLFVHGGIHKDITTRYSKKTIPITNLILKLFLQNKLSPKLKSEFEHIYLNDNGICWTREYSQNKLSQQKCGELNNILDVLDIKHIIVGHTLQENGITLECPNKSIIKIDVGISGAFNHMNKQAIMITNNNKIKIIK